MSRARVLPASVSAISASQSPKPHPDAAPPRRGDGAAVIRLASERSAGVGCLPHCTVATPTLTLSDGRGRENVGLLRSGQARGSEMIVLRPGWLSSSFSSPPCRRATAEARLSPKPDPGCDRLCSRRTKRSTARVRSPAGMPPPPSATVSRIRSPSPNARITIAASLPLGSPPAAVPYFMALSTRLASAWLMSSRLPCTSAGCGASTWSRIPLSSASGS